MKAQKSVQTEVCVIGGGATGAGILRDLALRGIDAVLVEKNDLATGASGRNHGLLHSGARYAVKDKESAKECIIENKILKKIAPHCVEKTGGFFVALEQSDEEYAQSFYLGCKICQIDVANVPLDQAFNREPHLSRQARLMYEVPDGSVDPFRLTVCNALDAKENGSRLFLYSELISATLRDNKIYSVTVFDKRRSQKIEIQAQFFINAAGPWAQIVSNRLFGSLRMAPSMGVMVILDHRVVNTVINRLRPPGDGDIIVPGDTVSIIGTTSRNVDASELDNLESKPEEIYQMIKMATQMVPRFGQSRMLRYYAGARPLPVLSGQGGREASRNFLIYDHSKEDEVSNVYSIVGGKLMTYRLMAEKMVDTIASKLGNTKKCSTHQNQLPPLASKGQIKRTGKKRHISNYGITSGINRQGAQIADKLTKPDNNLVCECEMVTYNELQHAQQRDDTYSLADLRRRTRMGMGPCQGTLCANRVIETEIYNNQAHEQKTKQLEVFIQGRWQGIQQVLWGDTLRMEEFAMWLYSGIWGWQTPDIAFLEENRNEKL